MSRLGPQQIKSVAHPDCEGVEVQWSRTPSSQKMGMGRWLRRSIVVTPWAMTEYGPQAPEWEHLQNEVFDFHPNPAVAYDRMMDGAYVVQQLVFSLN